MLEPFQRAIEDEKKARLSTIGVSTGVGSLGCGLTNATYGWPLAEAEPRRHGVLDIHGREWLAQGAPRAKLFAHGLIQLLTTNYDTLKKEILASRTETKRGSTGVVVTGPSPTEGFRQRELEWRRTHSRELQRYENQWVVLEGEEVISHGSDPAQVIQEAKARGIRKPYVFFVERQNENVITMGL